MKYRNLMFVLTLCIYTSVFGQNSNRVCKMAERMSAKDTEITVPVGKYSMTMRYIAGGSFMMGSNSGEDQKPVHSANVSDLYLMEYEVTVGEYLEFCKETNGNWPIWLEQGNEKNVETGSDMWYKDKGYRRVGSERLPIAGVSWNDAVSYAKWLSGKIGVIFRLPTEVEWEYAARGGQSYKFSGSDDANEVSWNDSNSGEKPQEVGKLKANGYGLYDMSGNVWEWTSSWYKGYPGSSGVNDKTDISRVYRGGSWYFDWTSCLVSDRVYDSPDYRFSKLGFRLAASI